MSTFWFTVLFTVVVMAMTIIGMVEGHTKVSTSEKLGRAMITLTIALWVLMAYFGIYLN